MPRPMPDSKREAERDRLKVVITWYAFHTLTMRFVWGSGGGGGGVPAAVWPQEGLALGVESHHRFGGGQVGEVIAALAILGLVVDHPVDDLDLAERVIGLEVGGVVPGIPQAKLHAGDHREAGGRP